MNRREFMGQAAACAGAALSSRRARAQGSHQVRIRVHVEKTLYPIPADFIGLGYEISAIAKPGLLSAQNHAYVRLVRSLGERGVIRVGGNTSDYSSFSADGKAVSAPKATVVNAANLEELGTFLDATGWKLIWGLNLGHGTEKDAVEEAQAVAAAVGGKLLAFEIGNEPDLFGGHAAHRPESYSYDDYLPEYRRFKASIRVHLPNAKFAGPDAATKTDWVTRFAADEGRDLTLLTHHYYRECANPTSTLDKLLHTDPKLAPILEKLKTATMSSQVPYRICETNSFCGGGKPGVSDTFGSALWVLDFLFTLASHGAAGVNIETDVNQLGSISSYSPIGDDERGAYSQKPSYYGMLAFAKASQGQVVGLDYEAAGVNLTAYAVLGGDKRLTLTFINKDASVNAAATIHMPNKLRSVRVSRLQGPSLESMDGVVLTDPVSAGNEMTFDVPAASAAILSFRA